MALTDNQAKAFYHARVTQRLSELAEENQRRVRLCQRYGLPIRRLFCGCAYWCNACGLYRTGRLMAKVYILLTEMQNDYVLVPWNTAKSIYS